MNRLVNAARLEASSRPVMPAPEAVPSTAPRMLRALARLVLASAAVHVGVVIASALFRRDTSSVNAFTLLELQRLWPALATPAAAAWSVAVALAGFGLAYRATPPTPAERAAADGDGSASRGAYARALTRGIVVFLVGVAFHMGALATIETFVQTFPSVPDVIHASLPYVDFGAPGEMAFGLFLVSIAFVLIRRQPRSVPSVLTLLGVFYAMRGVFLFLLPIGVPPTAPAVASRFVLWPFAGHAYFPGGHAGMMTLVSLSLRDERLRRAFFVFTLVFAAGTLLARTHYSADALGGVLLGYGVLLWGRRRRILRNVPVRPSEGLAWSARPETIANGTNGWHR